MGIKTVQDTSLTSVANAIRVKAEISGTLEFPDEFVSAIQNISTGITPSGTKTITENGTYDVTNFASADVNVSGGGGGASVPPKEVNFYDYDGTVVDAYTATEFANLSAMPANPTHTGLTAQGWNWSLANAKTYVAKYGRLNIGQMYVTTSGDTEIDIVLYDGRLEPVLGIAPNGTVEIDWGDGSAKDTVTGASLTTNKNTQHAYTSAGSYTIKLHVVDGSFAIYGDSTLGCYLLHKIGTVSNAWRVYQNAIHAVRIGASASLVDSAFRNCYSLASVTIPEGVTSIGSNMFQNCYSLASVTIPEEVTSIGGSAFYNCYSLASVTIPEGVTSIGSDAFRSCSSFASVTIPEEVTSIGGSAFQQCYSLASVTIPESVTSISQNTFFYCYSLASVTIPDGMTSIGSNALNSCYGLKTIILKPTTPPTVANANAFNNLSSDLVVYVPAGTLSAYQSASNYSSIASKMVEMSA